MNLYISVISTIFLVSITLNGYTQRLDRFSSVTASFSRSDKVAKMAFPEIKTYFGYLPLDSNQTTNQGKRISLYLSLETDIKEIGIRVISPVPENIFPNKNEMVSDQYQFFQQDKKSFFDPVIKVFKASEFTTGDHGSKTVSWSVFAENDNSFELFPQPSGKQNNALIRKYDQHKTDSLFCKKGFYRIDIFPADTVMTSGSFIMQVGTTSEIPVIRLSEKGDGF